MLRRRRVATTINSVPVKNVTTPAPSKVPLAPVAGSWAGGGGKVGGTGGSTALTTVVVVAPGGAVVVATGKVVVGATVVVVVGVGRTPLASPPTRAERR